MFLCGVRSGCNVSRRFSAARFTATLSAVILHHELLFPSSDKLTVTCSRVSIRALKVKIRMQYTGSSCSCGVDDYVVVKALVIAN